MIEKPQIVGSWELIKCMMVDESDTVIDEKDPLSDARGRIIYSSNGTMSVQIVATSYLGVHANLDSTPNAAQTIFNQYHAYTGTYSINEEKMTVTHHVDISNHPEYIGKSLGRHFSFFEDGNKVSLKTVDIEQVGDVKGYHVALWKRSKP